MSLYCILYSSAEVPTIVCDEYQSVEAEKCRPSAVVVWEDIVVTDNSGNVLLVSCDPKTGTNVSFRQTTVICKVVDESGNRLNALSKLMS